MKYLRSLQSRVVFKCAVVPALLLCAIFRNPALQWFAVAASALWLSVVAIGFWAEAAPKLKRHKRTKAKPELSTATSMDAVPHQNPENSLFLIRQINYRVAEQLKSGYPAVAWLWVRRPTTEELCRGGAWRIRVSNADPFNFGEVAIDQSGKLTITMLQACLLKTVTAASKDDDSDLEEHELLDRVDVKEWYEGEGERVITAMIDNLNTQGHRTLLIRENGEVYVELDAGNNQKVECIQNFPPRMVWEEICQTLKEDEITASIKPDGLALAW